MKIEFTIYGEPVPKGRPKVAVRGKFARVYTPKKTRKWEDIVALQSLQYKPPQPLDCPLYVILKFHLQRPKSLPKKVINHIKRPDLDNLVKSILDPLNKIFWRDDSIIVYLTAMIVLKKPSPLNSPQY
jgi:Holliday junction resolvase RusA-like endonuclease